LGGGLGHFWVDLHVHTALSPCGELEMGARGIVARARESRIDVIAISDHNTCENYPAIASLADGNPVVLPAMEVQTSEDIHVLAVFPDYYAAAGCKEWLWRRMPPTPNDPDVFGYQVIVDSNDDIVRMEETLLIQGAGYDVDTVVSRLRACGAVSLLAHVDRPSFAYPAVLGPFPDDYPVDAFELSCGLNSDEADEWRKKYPRRTFIRSSDSHSLDTLSRDNCTRMLLGAPTLEEIRLALRGEGGRRVSWPWG
jgi:PHP family Zn ribbon phosphoesterase